VCLPVTRRGSFERYDSVGFTPSFVRLESSMMGPVGSTVSAMLNSRLATGALGL
jgi:hypothetical protein